MRRIWGVLRPTIGLLAPSLVCLVILIVLMAIYLQTDPGTSHRTAELLIVPAVIALLICLARLGMNLIDRLSFLRRGRWGFDPHSGGFYGEYGVDFQTSSGSGRRRRRRSRR